jgi:hypothetical protein
MGYWVSIEPESFLEGMFIMEKYEFFYFPQCTHCSVKLHLLVYIVLDSSNLQFRRLECGLG